MSRHKQVAVFEWKPLKDDDLAEVVAGIHAALPEPGTTKKTPTQKSTAA